MDWSKLPDLAAVALLTCAFASVARRGHTPISRLWLTGWSLIALHFAASMFQVTSGARGVFFTDVALVSLADAGILFMYASVPYRKELSSRYVMVALLVTNTLYICLDVASPTADWLLNLAAVLFGAVPLGLALYASPRFQHSLRWIVVGLYSALAVYLLAVQHLPNNGGDLALDGVFFTVYLGCCLHIWYTYRRSTAGALITITGFVAWAFVFVVAPWMEAYYPRVQIESEVWNLPKYVVAVGMILLLLEDQLEHNKYLALHDELTGLPNRRLFLDRLGNSLERARRSGTVTALLVVDLDQFKQVNDTLGHHVGDLLLQKVGGIFTARVRTSDTVARTGGDEFSVILENATDRANATQIAQSLLEHLNEPLQVEENAVWVGASVGVALFPDDASNLESLCIAADLRMYGQKNESRELGRGHRRERSQIHSDAGPQMRADYRVTPERFTV